MTDSRTAGRHRRRNAVPVTDFLVSDPNRPPRHRSRSLSGAAAAQPNRMLALTAATAVTLSFAPAIAQHTPALHMPTVTVPHIALTALVDPAAVSALQNAVTAELARRQGIPHTIVPMSDDPVRSLILTDEGDLAFQDYFVRRRCEPRFISIRFAGAEQARIAPGLAAGLTTWTSGEPPFDIAGKGSGNYLVGSPETVAALMNQLSDKLDIDTWILSGWPLAAEAERFATQVMPLLDVAPYEPPVLRG